MSHVFFHITAGAYLIVTFIYAAYLFSHRDGFLAAAKYGVFAVFSTHSVTIILRSFEAGRFPATSLYESLTLFSWLMVAVYLAFLKRYRLAVLGAFVAPFALLLLLTASLLPVSIVPLSPVLASWWLPVHVVLAFLGNAFFALACLFGIMYLIQEHYLKSRKLGGLYFVFPSLEVLDDLNYRCIRYGFPLLTLAMITGAVWSEYAFGTYWMWKHRQVWSLIMWFLYAALLHGRISAGWRGRKSALFSVAAFIVLLSTAAIIYFLVGEGHGLLIKKI